MTVLMRTEAGYKAEQAVSVLVERAGRGLVPYIASI